MTGKSGTGAARTRPPLVAVVALGLWVFAWIVYSRAPLPERGILVFRVDANEIVAYPRSDAAMDYLNGMALASHGAVETVGRNGVARLDAAAALPTRWSR